MAISQELLEYQKVDGELRSIEKALSASEERKKYIQAKKFIEQAAERLEQQDKRAAELRRLAQKLEADYQEINRAISEYADLDDMVAEGGDVSFYKKNVQSLMERLRMTKGELNKLLSDIESACEEYQKLKKATISMQKQYKEYSEKFKQLRSAHAKEADEIAARLKVIGEKIPKDILEKYKQKRKENIFPVIVPLTNGRCVCGMDFAIAQQSALSGGNVIECEHCHRFIYKE